MEETFKCSDLKPGDIVIFKMTENGQEEYWDGTVSLPPQGNGRIDLSYLEGYKHRDASIPYKDMVAKFDRDFSVKWFGCLSGPSVLLVAE